MPKKSFVIVLAFVALMPATFLSAQQALTSSDTSSAASASQAPQVPRLIRFSGSVTAHEARTVGITFALYKDQSGGAPLWQEVQNVTLDTTGHYSVLLGATSKDGIPAELFTSNEARWLGV
ncbi:MAG: hypothetical protein ACHP9S_02375, partial [Terriglobales bacterium]